MSKEKDERMAFLCENESIAGIGWMNGKNDEEWTIGEGIYDGTLKLILPAEQLFWREWPQTNPPPFCLKMGGVVQS